jgi:hypothetical protein
MSDLAEKKMILRMSHARGIGKRTALYQVQGVLLEARVILSSTEAMQDAGSLNLLCLSPRSTHRDDRSFQVWKFYFRQNQFELLNA